MSDRIPDYAQGFKDGFAAGLEEGKKLVPVKSVDPFNPNYLGTPGTCSVCGKYWGNSVWGYVCSNQHCPGKVTAYSAGGAVTGAVGTMGQLQTYSTGANGPTMND